MQRLHNIPVKQFHASFSCVDQNKPTTYVMNQSQSSSSREVRKRERRREDRGRARERARGREEIQRLGHLNGRKSILSLRNPTSFVNKQN